jgi:nitrate/TMAO reductase-like tetraheme cytochrome c subunit
VPIFQRFREHWVRPALFFGNNPISLAGGAITTASGVTMIAHWVVELIGRRGDHPYEGIIFFLILPALFVLGLVLIPIGMWLRRRKLRREGHIPAEYPKIDLNDRVFRHGIDIVLIATVVNLLIVSIASYRGASYMDSPQFCGSSCHVMHPEYSAYQVSSHSHVHCVECHIGTGARSYLEAKVNGTKQLIEVTLRPIYTMAPKLIPTYPQPIPSPVTNLRPAREICEACHTPTRFYGEKLLVKSSFADDETNSETQSVVVLHLGGRDSLSNLSGIHGVHLGHIEYITTDETRTNIPWVQRRNPDGSETTYAASSLNGKEAQGERRLMDCIDCHNRAAHTMQTAEDALNRAMAEGGVSPELPWMHKKALELLKANYNSEAEAIEKIPAGLEAFYRTEHPDVYAAKANLIKSSGEGLVSIFTHNAFPDMKVTWGTHPNHIGHMSYPGCFRCHDGDHTAKDGKSITQDCAACHNLLAVDEKKPKVLSDLGIATPITP